MAPPDELARLRAIHRLRFEPGKTVKPLDHICAVAAKHFDVPIAVVSLVDETELYFVGHFGTPATAIPRAASAWQHEMASDEMMVVEDTLLDPRFAGSPLVAGPPFVRFFAGSPITLGDPGVHVGSICIVDRKPRSLTFAQKLALRQIASIAMAELEALTG